MKLSPYLLSILLGTLLLFGCSERIPNKYEQLYLDTTDSLRLYKDVNYLKKEFESSEKARDYLTLDFEEFKEKHDLTDEEMEILSKIMQGHVDIARLLNSM